MSEYIFPKTHSYTTLNGSGSCDPPCQDFTIGPDGWVANCGEKCVDGECVPKPTKQCIFCDAPPPGYIWDLADVCEDATDPCCGYRLKDPNNPNDPIIRVIEVNRGKIESLKFTGNETVLIKNGEGTLILSESRPLTLGTVVINNGTVIVTTTEIFNDRSGDCDLPPPIQPPDGWDDVLPPPEQPIERPFCGGVLTGPNSTLVLSPRSDEGNCNPLCVCTFGGLSFGSSSPIQNFTYTSQATPEYNGKLIIDGNTQIVLKNGTYEKNDIKNLLALGRNDGSWNGSTGITTNYSINDIKSIGYYVNENNDMILQFALPGDTNLDGIVDILDVSNIVASGKYNSEATDADWIDGDFNYDGIVDILDVALFLSTDAYGNGNYLPQSSEFEITWTPPANQGFSTTSSIRVSTADQTELLPYNIYGDSFVKGDKEYYNIGIYTTHLDCKLRNGIAFNPNASNCHDAACEPPTTQFVPTSKISTGSCCIDGECIQLADDVNSNGEIIKAASYKCVTDLRGQWLGYNIECDVAVCVPRAF